MRHGQSASGLTSATACVAMSRVCRLHSTSMSMMIDAGSQLLATYTVMLSTVGVELAVVSIAEQLCCIAAAVLIGIGH